MNASSCLKMILLALLASTEMVLAQQANTQVASLTPEQINQKVEQSGACAGNPNLQRTLLLTEDGRIAANADATVAGADVWKIQNDMACANGIQAVLSREPANDKNGVVKASLMKLQGYINLVRVKMGRVEDYRVTTPADTLGRRG